MTELTSHKPELKRHVWNRRGRFSMCECSRFTKHFTAVRKRSSRTDRTKKDREESKGARKVKLRAWKDRFNSKCKRWPSENVIIVKTSPDPAAPSAPSSVTSRYAFCTAFPINRSCLSVDKQNMWLSSYFHVIMICCSQSIMNVQLSSFTEYSFIGYFILK